MLLLESKNFNLILAFHEYFLLIIGCIVTIFWEFFQGEKAKSAFIYTVKFRGRHLRNFAQVSNQITFLNHTVLHFLIKFCNCHKMVYLMGVDSSSGFRDIWICHVISTIMSCMPRTKFL